MQRLKYLFILSVFIFNCSTQNEPEPFGAMPSKRQLKWHQLKFYAFVHFGPNTFTDKEWGYGDTPPSAFNPSHLDCRQWAKVASEAGMDGILITAKHHDGFCLWPTKTTDYSVKSSPWKNGMGDVIQELRHACDQYGLKLGIYLSPWDRHQASYGTPDYINIYRQQARELLSNYGDIFEFWFDGANGGDGYYGGARETRRIDNKTYYDWPNTHKIVRELQPGAVMFSDGGPDIRWIGNERGYAIDPNWSTIRKNSFYPGIGGVNDQLQTGHEDGDTWLPAEVNTSIRPGWFYHPDQDDKVKSLNQLIDNWFHSVGMNGNFILNIPPDRRGLFHENDVSRLMEFKKWRDEAFSENFAEGAAVSATNIRRGFTPENAIDSDSETCWATEDGVTQASLVIDFGKVIEVNCLLIKEYIRLGQRVKGFAVEVNKNGNFYRVAEGITVGNRRLVPFEPTKTDKVKIVLNGKACLVISDVEIYRTPDLPKN